MKSNKMKAAYRKEYGPPESLKIKKIEIPKLKENEILIKVHAATVNRTDCAVLSGSPYIMRLFTGLFKPKLPITGTDFAGKVEAVGNEVADLTGVHLNTVRLYEEWGYISEVKRASNNYRQFTKNPPVIHH